MSLPTRKHPRLKHYDYSQTGYYHITLCTKNRVPVLSRILPPDSPLQRATIQLTPVGIITDSYIANIPHVYPGVVLDKYAIMPNHIHLLLFLSDGSETSVPTIVRSLKRMVTTALGQSIWQDSFYDVIIRSNAMYRCEWEYIDCNPDKWAEDELYVP